MLKKIIKFEDYNGNIREEEFLFNLNKVELLRLECNMPGGIEEYTKRITQSQDNKAILATFEDIVKMACGRKSPDGRQFEKSEEISKTFMETEAYSEFMMEILQKPESADAFIKGILPSSNDSKITNMPNTGR